MHNNWHILCIREEKEMEALVEGRGTTRAILVAVMLVCVSCLLHASTRSDRKDVTVAGIWKSEGYGYVFQVEQSEVQAFEITSVSCIATWKSMRIEKGPTESDAPGWVENPLQRHDSKEYNLGWWFGPGFAGGDRVQRR